jgi:ABC-type transport system involved in cytochrome c biogenesis permease component
MRWLLVKDLQILRRSPLLVGLLVVYPVAVALMIGFALSSPPGKPKVAYFSQIAPGHGKVKFGSQTINVSHYASELFKSIQPIRVHSRAQAIATVRSGQALAALIVPADITSQIESLVTQGVGSPTVQLILNSHDPLERQFVQQTINSNLNQVEQAVSKQVLRVAISDLQEVLKGGTVNIGGTNVRLLGLRTSRSLIQGAITALPRGSAFRPALQQVVNFAGLAIQGLAFASPVLGSIGTPLTVQQTQLSGRTTPADSYAATIAVDVSLMLVTLVLAASLLAVERSENTYSRLVRGLVRPEGLLGEKVLLSALGAGLLALLMAALVSTFVHLDWGRFELWVVALGVGGLAFGALGVAIGALAREVSAASLLAVLISLPVAFVALVPGTAVSSGVGSALDVVAFVFPFRAALDATGNAFSAASPGMVGPLAHLVVLTIVFGVVARLAIRRFA